MMKTPPDFEQFTHYGQLPDTGMEVNLREIYDLTSKAIRDPKQRDAAADALANLVRTKTQSVGVPLLIQDEESISGAQRLKEEGFTYIPNVLTSFQIEDIEQYLSKEPIYDFYNPDRTFQLKDAPTGTNIGRYTTEVNINCPHIFKALNHPSVLKIVEKFLGAPPTLSVVMLMWSFPNDDPAKYMQLFHRDSDDYRFCKIFVYLTDVDDEMDGPHLYISCSNGLEEVQQKIDVLDLSEIEKQRSLTTLFAGHPQHRYDENLVEAVFSPEQFIKHLGKKGTTFIENTWGIHRGLPPKRKPRLLLQGQYTLQASPMFTYSPREIKNTEDINKSQHQKYVNRLYTK